jgi:hypothetical protein
MTEKVKMIALMDITARGIKKGAPYTATAQEARDDVRMGRGERDTAKSTAAK